MDAGLSLIVLVCVLWSVIGLVWPKSLFFALVPKEKRIHSVFFLWSVL